MFQYIQETERQGTPERDEQGGAFKFLAGYYLKRDLLDEAYEFAIKCTQLADVVEELLAFIIWQIFNRILKYNFKLRRISSNEVFKARILKVAFQATIFTSFNTKQKTANFLVFIDEFSKSLNHNSIEHCFTSKMLDFIGSAVLETKKTLSIFILYNPYLKTLNEC